MSRSYQNASFPITTSRIGIGSSNAVGGMPAKFGPSSNGTGFASARQLYFTGALNKPKLLSQLLNSEFSKSSYNYLGTKNAQSLQNGKPIPNNSSDLYISRKKNRAIARSSTKLLHDQKNNTIEFRNVNPQDVTRAKQHCRNQGCVPSKKVVQNRVQNTLGCC